MVTAGLDGTVKVWDTRKWGVLNEYQFKKTPQSAAFSQKGLLGLGWGNHISVRSVSAPFVVAAGTDVLSFDSRSSTISKSPARTPACPLLPT